VFQLREREIAVKEKAQEHKEKKDAIDSVLKVGEIASDEKLDYARIESQERMKGADIGANLVTFGKELDNQTREEGIKLGTEVTKTMLDQPPREVQKMVDESDHRHMDRQHEAEQKQMDRDNQVRIAAMKPKPKPNGSK
jgi:hypothetical protein